MQITYYFSDRNRCQRYRNTSKHIDDQPECVNKKTDDIWVVDIRIDKLIYFFSINCLNFFSHIIILGKNGMWDTLYFTACKIIYDVTYWRFAKIKRFGDHVRKKNLTLNVHLDQQLLNSFEKCNWARQKLAK